MKYSINKTKQALSELQTTLHWAVTMIKAPNAVGQMPENVHIRCMSSGVPEATEEVVPVELQGHKINYVGKTTKAGTIDLQFVEGTDAAVIDYFTRLSNAKWSGDGKDTKGTQRLTNDLKFDLRIELMGPDDVTTQVYELIGCMGNMNKGISLAQTADAVQPTLSLEYDDFHYHHGSVKW